MNEGRDVLRDPVMRTALDTLESAFLKANWPSPRAAVEGLVLLAFALGMKQGAAEVNARMKQ